MDNFLSQVAELLIVARCDCIKLRSWRSQNHLDCLFVEPWIIEQINIFATKAFENKNSNQGLEELRDSPNYCESLDSLQTETTTTTFDKLSFMPFSKK